MILGLHIRDTKNAGDRFSCPLDYFSLPGEVVQGDMRSPPACRPDAVVYGGGSITASPDFHGWECPVIAWGVGHHIRDNPESWDAEMAAEHARAASMCALYFPRDAVDSASVTPCASCMHPVFDERITPTHECVWYSAARRVDVSGVGPHMTNEDGDIEAAVRFLASGEMVVTSSYHGLYWARLLGRKVRAVPWGSKFSYLPELSLEECRDANRRAHAATLDLLYG